MFAFLDVSTAYFIAGLMYFIMPLIVWGSLRNTRHPSVTHWFIGGEFFALGILLLAVRPQVPEWASYDLANSLLAIGSLLRLKGLLELQDKHQHNAALIILGVAHSGGYILARQLLPDTPLFFVWSLLCIALELGLLSWHAHRIAQDQSLPSMRWLAGIYTPLVLLLLVRATTSVLWGNEPANILTNNAVSVWIAMLGVVAAVVSNTSFLAMFVERAAKEREAQLALTAQRQATDILASKIAELDRQRSAYTTASTLSHELSQPLTSIQLYLDIWRANPQHTELQTILQGVDESTQLATGILQRMRDYGNSQRIQLQTVDLLKIHQQVMALMHNWLKAENVSTQLHTNTPAALIEGDALQLSQVLINLYRNAAQASAQQARPQLHIHISSSPSHVTLQVRDNGPGFSPEALAQGGRVNFTSTKEQGMGIGLSIVRNIVEQHNADITLSNAPEGGALVQITFPALER